jgi:hypothetical protein
LFVASYRTLSGVAGRFTIGRVLVQSWLAFLADRWRYLGIAIVISAVSLAQTHLSGEVDPHCTFKESFYTLWTSAAIMSFAIAPITLGIIEPGGGRSGMLEHLRDWRRTLRVVFAACVLQTAAYWPLAAMIELGLAGEEEYMAAGYLVLSINVVVIGTLAYLYYPILLAERCSVWSSAIRSVGQVRPHFWRVAALTMIFWLAYIGGSMIVVIATYSVDQSVADWAYYAIWSPLVVVLVLAGNVLPAVVYRLLRIEREGPDPEQVAGVFE